MKSVAHSALLGAACFALLGFGCFGPDISGDLLCGPDDQCPPGQMCDGDGVCREDPASIDATPGGTDASPASFRRLIDISNQTDAELTDYQVPIVLDTAELIDDGKMRADCGDIRFTDADGVVLPYFLESGCDTTGTVLWVRVASIPTAGAEVYIRYGNPASSSTSDPGTTFHWFDDYSIDSSSRYSVTGSGWLNGLFDNLEGSIAWANETLSMDLTSADNAMTLLELTGLSMQDLAVDVQFHGGATHPTSHMAMVLVRAQDAGNWYGGVVSLDGSTQNHTGIEQRTGGTLSNVSASSVTYPLSSLYEMTVAVAADQMCVMINGDVYESSVTGIDVPGSVLIGTVQLDVAIDDLRVRNYAVPEPVTRLGSEQAL